MNLNTWFQAILQLRSAFSREITFYWFALICLSMSFRRDFLGVSSLIRCLFLSPSSYSSLLKFFSSGAINLQVLTRLWSSLVLKLFDPFLFKVNGRIILLVDELKAPKEGKKMAGIKKHHQDSQNNSKKEFIWGHALQALSVLVGINSHFISIPLIIRIHQGIGPKNRTVIDKVIDLIRATINKSPAYIVGDAYYFAGKLLKKCNNHGHHLISRVKSNGVAFELPGKNSCAGAGRPKKYGKKIYLKDVFNGKDFKELKANIYGKNEKILITEKVLLSKNSKSIFKYVFVVMENKNKIIFCTSDLELGPVQLIELYAHRFKIEVMFKDLVHNMGLTTYHFWSKKIEKIKKRSKDFTIQRDVKKELTYHIYFQLTLISYGLVKYLGIVNRDAIWSINKVWLRAINKNNIPPTAVVGDIIAKELQMASLEYSDDGSLFKRFIKFIREKQNIEEKPAMREAS